MVKWTFPCISVIPVSFLKMTCGYIKKSFELKTDQNFDCKKALQKDPNHGPCGCFGDRKVSQKISIECG